MRTLIVAAAFIAAAAQGLIVAPGVAQVVDPAPAPGARPDLPPVETFYARPRYSDFTLSPDGRLLAAVVPSNERRNLALVDLDKGTVKLLTSLTTEDVAGYRWIGDRTIELVTANLADAMGLVAVRQIVVIDTNGRLVRDLHPTGRRSPARIIATLDRDGDELIIESNERSETSLDAYRFNPRTNAKQLLTFESPGEVVRYVADRAGQVRVAVSIVDAGTRSILSYRRDNDAKWTTLRNEPIDAVTVSPAAFDFDNKTLYVHAADPGNGGRSSVHAFDPETNRLGARLYEARDVDGGRLLFDEVRKLPVGVVDGSRDGVTWIDPEWKKLQESIDAALPSTRNFVERSRHDPSRVLVRTESETQPPIFFLLDRSTHRMQEVAAAYPSLKEENLSPRRFVRYAARDGLSIPAYLTIPKRPDGSRPPLIVDIHGGPFMKSRGFGYDADAQFFASRGYAVLQPDFRGTVGYGTAFEQAGWRQWGLAMQDDVTDGVKWLIDSGKVDADRVCLHGASYGGYATLWGLEKEPGMFRCGVAVVAVSDLEMMFDVTWSDFMRAERGGDSTKWLTRVIGDPDKDREKMRAVSPLYHADRIEAPLLLAYGASDRRVPLIHGNRMRSALDKQGKPYEWVVYTDEAHGFNKDENRFDFYRRVDAFLAKHLAPRAATASMERRQ